MSSKETEIEDFGASHCSLVLTRQELIDDLTKFLLDKCPWSEAGDSWAQLSLHHSDLEYDLLVRNLFAIEFVDGFLSSQKQVRQDNRSVLVPASIEQEHGQQIPTD